MDYPDYQEIVGSIQDIAEHVRTKEDIPKANENIRNCIFDYTDAHVCGLISDKWSNYAAQIYQKLNVHDIEYAAKMYDFEGIQKNSFRRDTAS